MVSADSLTPSARLESSAAKIAPPFELDPSMRFYSPQDNVDALDHPRVAEYLAWLRHDWNPSGTRPRVALILPCTATKPYPLSGEHRAVNCRLLDGGWAPDGSGRPPDELLERLPDDEDRRVLDTSTLWRDGVALDRLVISEPLALVPYPSIYSWRGGPSPATAYDDPGLFEKRGTSVAPWRSDSTARRRPNGSWAWGPCERDAYVEVHNVLAETITTVLRRVGDSYAAVLAWVSPGLTHRSFLMGSDQRKAEGLPLHRRGRDGLRSLVGVGDRAPGLVEILPTVEHMALARRRLSERLSRPDTSVSDAAVRGVYASGEGSGTPLGLPELLDLLVERIDGVVEELA